jgi:excisionase family DNA binding protein
MRTSKKRGEVESGDSVSPPLSYRPAEAAIALGISRSLLYLLLARGEIRSCHIGASRIIPHRELERWLALQMKEAGHAD